MRFSKLRALIFFIVVAAVLVVPALWATYAGCFVCVPDNALTWPSYECYQVGHNESGDGIYCDEQPGINIKFCSTSGGACFNVDSGGDGDGGGNGGGSGGGGGSCSILPGMTCPAECMSCEVIYY